MHQWLKLMTQPVGDEDASELAWPWIRTLLDVGLSIEELETLEKEYRNTPVNPLLRYAIAVQSARLHNYAKALRVTERLNLTKIPDDVLGSYYWSGRSYLSPKNLEYVLEFKQNMQTMLEEQRQRWQKLQTWQQEDTSNSRYRLASHWAERSGWKNGYLPVWDFSRSLVVPQLDSEDCERFWVCNLEQRNPEVVRSTYQNSNHNTVALSLYQKLLDDPNTPPEIREKTLYMVAATLLAQMEYYTSRETIVIHPPAGVSGQSPVMKAYQAANLREAVEQAYQTEPPDFDIIKEARKKRDQALDEATGKIWVDYQNHIDKIIATLEREFPESSYIDDLLFSRYFLAGGSKDLERILKNHPNGDMAVEAKFLLQKKAQSDQ